MFKCEACQKSVKSRTRCQRIVVETRQKTKGTEIVKEVQVCPEVSVAEDGSLTRPNTCQYVQK